jgi:hydroxyacylglutathione hydrolase
MLFRRIFNDRLAQAGYLVGCQRSREAIVVDPLRDPTPYLEAARQEGLRITSVTETHVHADFVSGAVALAEATGAALLLSGEGEGPASYQRDAYPSARWLHDGEALRIGAVELRVLHVPGHTPEHVAFLVTDTATSNAPMGLISGDFLFVGDVGRPDLLERAAGMEGTMRDSARQLFASLRRLDELPDFIQLWPGHGAGSACGKALGAMPQSTLGYERLTNWALAPMTLEDFTDRVLAGQPEPPPYFARMKRQNAGGASPKPTHARASQEALRDAVTRGASLVDVRPAADYAAGHLPRSINVPLGKSFLGWAGAVMPANQDIVLIASEQLRGPAESAARDLELIGIDRVLGVLPVERCSDIELITLSRIPAASIGASPTSDLTVLDVRTRSEWEEGHVPGARHVPLAELTSRLEELSGAGPIAVHCQGGSRSAVAASVLQAAGFDEVSNLEGGYSAWLRAGNSPERGS